MDDYTSTALFKLHFQLMFLIFTSMCNFNEHMNGFSVKGFSVQGEANLIL